MKIRLFISGITNESSRYMVNQRARAVPGVVGCQVSADGTCTIKCDSTTTIARTERMLIDQLTFDR